LILLETTKQHIYYNDTVSHLTVSAFVVELCIVNVADVTVVMSLTHLLFVSIVNSLSHLRLLERGCHGCMEHDIFSVSIRHISCSCDFCRVNRVVLGDGLQENLVFPTETWYEPLFGIGKGIWQILLPKGNKANLAFHPFGVGKWVPALAGKAKAGIACKMPRLNIISSRAASANAWLLNRSICQPVWSNHRHHHYHHHRHHHYHPGASTAFHPSGFGKWVPALAGKGKAGVVHSISGCTRGVQVKLWDPLRTRAIPERLRGVITTRCCTNTRLPYLYLKECCAQWWA